MICNGCGGEFVGVGGFFGYGAARISGNESAKQGRANYIKTFCPRCQHVVKDIILSSDLSDHWHKYNWGRMGEAYTEPYNND